MKIGIHLIAAGIVFSLSLGAQAQGGRASCAQILSRRSDENLFTRERIRGTLLRIEEYWRAEFLRRGWPFEDIRYALYDGSVQTRCGLVAAANGPIYCSSEKTIYLAPAFFGTARLRLGHESEAMLEYILAHEVGHHIQALRNSIPRAEQISRWFQPGNPEAHLVPRLEFQADCLAGIFMRHLHQKSALDDAQMLESVLRMVMMGDDAQNVISRAQGTPVGLPSHGTSAERLSWYLRGLTRPSVENCEPFEMAVL